jgi:type VI secretion system ImpM family protein
MRRRGEVSATLGLFGKIAAEPDFVSLGDDRWTLAGLDTWLQRAVAAVKASQRPFPAQSLLLLGVHDGGDPIVAAVWPSADAAGRPFPLVVFADPDVGSAEASAAFVLDESPVVRAAAAVAACATAGGDVAALEAVLRAAATVFDEGRRAAETRVAEVLGSPARPLLNELGDAAAYAFTTLRTACREARDAARESGEATELLVRCPGASESARAFWVVFASRLLDSGPLSFVHVREPEKGYVDLCIGAPPAALIDAATSEETGPGHWSLVPRGAEACEVARGGLALAEAVALAVAEPTFADLLLAFAPQ